MPQMSDGLRHRPNAALSTKNGVDREAHKSSTISNDQHEISSLNRTRNMLQTELERISHVSNALDSDGHILASTKEEYQSMQEETAGAKKSLFRLKRLEMEDSIIFWSAVAFFYLVCLYIICSRIRLPFLSW